MAQVLICDPGFYLCKTRSKTRKTTYKVFCHFGSGSTAIIFAGSQEVGDEEGDMDDSIYHRFPALWEAMQQATEESGFPMASDAKTGSLLRTLAAAKPDSAFLELGTGTGLSTAWILDGMDTTSTLVTVDNEAAVQSIAQRYLGHDPRVTFHLADGGAFLEGLAGQQFDYIFADTWPGKYTHLDLTLSLLKPGAFYILDDMLQQPNWPIDHPQKWNPYCVRWRSATI